MRRTLLPSVLVAAVLPLLPMALPGAPAAAAATAHAAQARPRVHLLPRRAAGKGPDADVKDGHYCDGCTPPLDYLGGPVVDTAGPGGLTVTPIYWSPAGSDAPFPGDYVDLIDGFVSNVAAASGTAHNVFSVATEYYSLSRGRTTRVGYDISAGTAITDANPYAGKACKPDVGYRSCVTDAQIQAEVSRIVVGAGRPIGLAEYYPVFFPPGVETMDDDGSTSADSFCGYHSSYDTAHGVVLYSNEPYEDSGCDAGQSPNDNPVADASISTLSHELNETMTDPDGKRTAWNDSSGYEVADICAGDYGAPLGSTSRSRPASTAYNQVINGGRYYLQTEFSNRAFSAFGSGNGCQQSETAATTRPSASGPGATSLFTYATPDTLPADGSATSDIQTQVTDANGDGIPGDHVTFTTYAVQGTGQCGQLSRTSVVTDGDGNDDVSYRASRGNVVCAVVAVDSTGGASSTATVFQGTYRQLAPTAADTFPARLREGGTPTSFTTSFRNPTSVPIVHAEIDLVIFPGDLATTNVDASQLRLQYSLHGARGPFVRAPLTGSTVTDGEIDAVIGRVGGTAIVAHSTQTIVYRMTVARSVATGGPQPLLSLEAYVNQINPATKSGTNLADTYSTDVRVLPAT